MACTNAPSIAIKFIMVVSFVLAISASRVSMGRLVPRELSMAERHEQWMAEHGIMYKDTKEKQHRLKVFSANIQYIESFNVEGKHKYKLGTNQFTDLTGKEFRAKYTCPMHPSQDIVTNATLGFKNVNPDMLPSEVDWRAFGAVTPVKTQLSGGCWAFSTIGAIEGIAKITTGNLISLSEQELMDCRDKSVPGYGFGHVVKYGIASEADYPYTGVVGDCKKEHYRRAATISNFHLARKDETALLGHVLNQPVSAGIDASGDAFITYSNGIFTGPCGHTMTHRVTIVGYGNAIGGKYWLIKNSWGTRWGEGGYMRLLRDHHGLCGITMHVLYPIF